MTSRLAVVVDHPAQHFSPAFRLLDRDAGQSLRTFYWRADHSEVLDQGFGRQVRWDVDLLDGHDWCAPQRGGVQGARELLAALSAYRPDTVLCFGWATPAARLALLWSLATRTKVLLYGDSTWQAPTRPRLLWVRALLLRVLFRLVDGALSTGTFNREFYIRHGLHPSRIFTGVYPADVAHYRRHADRAAARAQRGLPPDAFVIGYAGKLIPRKGVDELLRASALLPRDAGWTLVIVGTGSEEQELRRLADDLGIADRTQFLGFQNQSAMPGLLSMCDVVVVPSRRDMRVLVCVEAMAAGAAVVVSSGTAVWGGGDLIKHGHTGLVYPSGRPEELSEQLRALMADAGLLARLRAAGGAAADEHGPEALRDAIVRTIAG